MTTRKQLAKTAAKAAAIATYKSVMGISAKLGQQQNQQQKPSEAVIKNKLWQLGSMLEKKGLDKTQFMISEPRWGSGGGGTHKAGKAIGGPVYLYWMFDIAIDNNPDAKLWELAIVGWINELFADFNEQVSYYFIWR